MAEKGRGRSRGVDGRGSSRKPRRNITPTPGYRNRTANFISVISPLSAERPALFPPHIRGWAASTQVVFLIIITVKLCRRGL